MKTWVTDAEGTIVGLFIRTPYNYDTDEASEETGTSCPEETKTKQEFKDDVDINTIVEKFGITGEGPPRIEFPTEQDFTEAFDFQTSMNVLREAQESFMELPAKVRARFDNDPGKLLTFVQDADNQDEAIRLGIATRRPKEEPPKKTEIQELNESLKEVLKDKKH